MPIPAKRLSIAIALAATGLFHSLASADVAEVVTEQGDVMTFEYEGDMLRVNTPDNNEGYMLARDNKMYVVTMNNGQPMVFDLGSTFKMFGGMATSATPDAAQSKVLSLEPTGESETLAGIQGDVYTLRFIDHEGKEQQADMLLSEDPRAVGFRDAIQNMAMTMAAALDTEQYQDELEAGEDMQKRLQALNMGVLRYGKDMQVRSITESTVDPQRFALPAEPTDLGALGGGMLGGILGGGSQQEQPAEAEEEEQPTSTAGEVGKAVGEALGNIFGN